MDIRNVIAQIPEDATDEALASIQSITVIPMHNCARLICHLAHKFRLTIAAVRDGCIEIRAEGRAVATVNESTLLPALKREIYEIDEQMAAGRYEQSPVKPMIITDDRPPIPDHFDIPAWDSTAKVWYDAEY
ncbi:hypothetical protein [Marinimicrobium sp. ABcell2]|uniref:hypothetical protein n=1 Tax=Marinimicrobium sp. ABcell2 TaxID=3069751 RepID=UPI0027AEF7F4|nr:hypothetical protein [Marinimicrobium sp. ABcell2]MDQ2077448.1 hypothetical protein [Marinimicrobium sp. ABcell2]